MTIWSGAGLRVVELGSGIAAAYASRLLSDFDADVIKVESPDRGDVTRMAGPFPGGTPDPEQSGLFLYLNYNKRGVTLDIHSTEGAAALAALIATCDVVVEDLGAGVLAGLPLPPGTLDDPRLIVCSISPYGQSGPKAGYKGTDLSAYAVGGMMYITGEAEREPLKHALHQASHLAGVNASAAILAAAIRQRRKGVGDVIDISLQETMVVTAFPALSTYTHTGAVMVRGRGQVPHLISSMPMETSDGWILPSYAGIGQWWDAFAQFVEAPHLAEGETATPAGRRVNGDYIEDEVAPRFKARTTADIFHNGQEWGLTFTALQTAEDIVNSDQMRERGHLVQQQHPRAGTVTMPGMVPHTTSIDRTPRRHAPLLGEHNAEILGELGLDEPVLAAIGVAPGAAGRRAE